VGGWEVKFEVNAVMLFVDYSADILKANPVTLLVRYVIYNAYLSRSNPYTRFLDFLPEKQIYFLIIVFH
jgi:hypothetical protein